MVTVSTDQQPEVICLVVQLDILHTLMMVCVFVCVCKGFSLYIALFILLYCISPILVLTFIFLLRNLRNQLLILLSSVHFAEIWYAAVYRSMTVYGLSNVTE